MRATPFGQSIQSAFRALVDVLHAFQKKSKKGVSTPQKQIELVKQRLAAAERDYREGQN